MGNIVKVEVTRSS